MNRPFVWLALALATGILAASLGAMPGLLLPGLIGAAAVALAAVRRWSRIYAMAPVIAFFAVGAFMYNMQHAGPPGDTLSGRAWAEPAQTVTLQGRVRQPGLYNPPEAFESDDEPERAYLTFVLDVQGLVENDRLQPLSARSYIRWSEVDRPIHADQLVRVTGRLDPTMGTVNFGISSIEDYLRRRDVHSQVRAYGGDAIEVVGDARWWWAPYYATRFRAWQSQKLREVVPASCIPFVFTVWLGDRSGIAREMYQRYVESGTAHILAVSGIHMGILFLSAMALLRLRFSRRPRALILMVIVLGFALTAGARISALRAATMLIIYLIGDLFDRDSDAPTALSQAALLFLIINPNNLFDAGFQLSFLSVASILLFAEPIQNLLERARTPRRLSMPLGATLGVQILPLPAAIYTFHVLPLLSPIANLAVVPLLSIALWLCFLTSLTLLLFEPAALLFGHALLPVVWVIEQIVNVIGATGISHVKLTSPTPVAIAALLAAAFIAIRGTGEFPPKRRFVAVLVLIFVGVAFWRPLNEKAMLAFLDVGHGGATVIRTSTGATALIDGGDTSSYVDLGERVVEPFLFGRGINKLDVVIATHADRDHMGGLFHVLSSMQVETLVLGPNPSEKPLELDLIALANERGVPIRRVAAGDVIELGDVPLRVLHPPRAWPTSSSSNNESIVVDLVWHGQRVLLTADIEAEAERHLAPLIGDAPILKVPHHGSHTSSTETFLRAVDPKVAFVSTGRRPRRQPVHPEVAARYADLGVPVWRTDYAGGLSLEMEQGRLVFRSAREARGYPVITPTAP